MKVYYIEDTVGNRIWTLHPETEDKIIETVDIKTFTKRAEDEVSISRTDILFVLNEMIKYEFHNNKSKM